jgi:alkyl sulfatase BDS1-like metallo-beta-lactamase superfamily hydrolase
MSTELFFDYLAIRLDSRKLGDAKFRMNFKTPDTGEQFVVELSNATLTTISGFQASDADVTVTVNRSDFERVMMQQSTLQDLIISGMAKTEGNPQVLAPLMANMTTFTPDFEVLPGTAQAK